MPRSLPSSSMLALAVLLATAGVGAAGESASPSAPIRVVAQRTIEVPDSRIVSMSPDGRSLAAVRPAGGYPRGSLCVVAIDTLEDRACGDLSVLDAGLRLEDVVWSPDSRRLAFAERSFMTFVDGDLWVMDAASGRLTNLDDDGFHGRLPLLGGEWPESPITVPVSPTFTPDSSAVTFSRSVLPGPGIQRNVIATVPLDGGPVTDLVTVSPDQMGIAYFGMRWAPDGSRLYYSVQDPDRSALTNGVWVVDADGTDARLFVGRYQDTHGPAILAVSGDGGTLLLHDPEAFGAFSGQLPAFATADTEHGTPTPLVSVAPDAPEHAYVGWAGLSPDGRWVLTVDRLLSPDNQIRARAPGAETDVALLPEGLESVGGVERGLVPTWSPNGTVLLTGAGRFGTATLLTIEGGTGG